jgi:WD40 repeat protein
VLTGSDDGTAKLWDAQSGLLLYTLKRQSTFLSTVEFSTDSKTVLITGSGSVDANGNEVTSDTAELWDVQSGSVLHVFSGREAVFSPDGKMVLIGSDNTTASLRDVQSGRLLYNLHGATGLAVSPDSSMVFTSSTDSARLWDAQSGKLLRTLPDYPMSSAVFAPDSRMLLTSHADKNLRLWDVQSGKLLHILQGHTESIRKFAFSPDGKLIFADSFDNLPIVWDAETGQISRVFCPRILTNSWWVGIGIVWLLAQFILTFLWWINVGHKPKIIYAN